MVRFGRNRGRMPSGRESASGVSDAQENNPAAMANGVEEDLMIDSLDEETQYTADPTQELFSTLGRFYRYLNKAQHTPEGGAWCDDCMGELMTGLEISIQNDWEDVKDALIDTARILQSYENARRPGDSVPFLKESYEILSLMVGDLIVENVRSGVKHKWIDHYQRAVEELDRRKIPLVEDEDTPAASAAKPDAAVVAEPELAPTAELEMAPAAPNFSETSPPELPFGDIPEETGRGEAVGMNQGTEAEPEALTDLVGAPVSAVSPAREDFPAVQETTAARAKATPPAQESLGMLFDIPPDPAPSRVPEPIPTTSVVRDDKEGLDDTPEGLLRRAQVAMIQGDIGHAKAVALELAATMARLEYEQARAAHAQREQALVDNARAAQAAQAAVEQAEQSLAALDRELAAREADGAACRDRLSTVDEAIRAMTETLAAIEERMEALRREHDDQLRRIESKQGERAEVIDTESLIQTEMETLAQEADQARRRLAEAGNRVQRIREERRDAEIKAIEARATAESRRCSMEEIARAIHPQTQQGREPVEDSLL